MTYIPRCPWYLLPGRMTLQGILHAVGEPLGFQPTPEEAAGLLERTGLQVRSDTDTHGWHAQYADSRHPALIIAYERLAHAVVG